MTRTTLCLTALLTLAWLPAPALAHGGLFRGPEGPALVSPPSTGFPGTPRTTGGTASRPSTIVDPMGSPEVPFTDDRWEFWWEFNHDRFVGLRKRLMGHVGAGGPSFAGLSEEEKAQVILPALLESLRDRDDQVRSSALFALARIGGEPVQGYLRHALMDDPSLIVRTNAVLALGQARAPRAVDTLKELLWQPSTRDEVRMFAAVSLGVMASPDASAALREALGPEENRLSTLTRMACTYALGLTEDPANAPFLRSLAMAGDPDARLHSLQILALGRVGDRAANTILMDALQHSETQVRRSAAIALGAVARPADLDAVTALQRAAEADADRLVRNLADVSLGEIASHGGPEVVEDLRARLAESSAQQRPYLCLALGISRRSAALGDLLAVFRTEKSHSVRAACAVALGLLGRSEAVPLLRDAYRTAGDPYLRGYLAYALGQLGDLEVREELRQDLGGATSPALVRWSAVGLALLGDPTLQEALQQAYDQASSEVTRATVVHAMGLTGDRRAMEFLLEKGDPEGVDLSLVRAFATYSLGLICERGREPVASVYSRSHNYTLDVPHLGELFFLF